MQAGACPPAQSDSPVLVDLIDRGITSALKRNEIVTAQNSVDVKACEFLEDHFSNANYYATPFGIIELTRSYGRMLTKDEIFTVHEHDPHVSTPIKTRQSKTTQMQRPFAEKLKKDKSAKNGLAYALACTFGMGDLVQNQLSTKKKQQRIFGWIIQGVLRYVYYVYSDLRMDHSTARNRVYATVPDGFFFRDRMLNVYTVYKPEDITPGKVEQFLTLFKGSKEQVTPEALKEALQEPLLAEFKPGPKRDKFIHDVTQRIEKTCGQPTGTPGESFNDATRAHAWEHTCTFLNPAAYKAIGYKEEDVNRWFRVDAFGCVVSLHAPNLKAHADHWFPQALGGATVPENCILLNKTFNIKKSDTIPMLLNIPKIRHELSYNEYGMKAPDSDSFTRVLRLRGPSAVAGCILELPRVKRDAGEDAIKSFKNMQDAWDKYWNNVTETEQ